MSLLVGLLLALAFRSVEASPSSEEKATATQTEVMATVTKSDPKPTATHAPEDYQSVIPTVCVRHNEDGTFTGVFGYDNQNSSDVTIPAGDKNYISPSPNDQGQPTYFERGDVNNVFHIKFTEDQTITWHLTGPDSKAHSASASDGTRRCEGSEPKPTSTTAILEITPTNTEASGGGSPTPTDTPRPTATQNPTQPPTWTPRPTNTPASTSLPPAPPAATNTPVPTSIPTLAPPAPVSSVTPVLIPVTGADETHNLPGQPVPLALVEIGFALLGLGAVLHGIVLKIEGR